MKRTFCKSLALLAGLAFALGTGRVASAAPPATSAAPAGKAHSGPRSKPPKADDKAAAPAEPTREERIAKARQLFAAAAERFAAGDFAGALDGFRASNEAARSPETLFRIALCLEKVGTPAQAEDAFHRFLGLPPPESMAELRRVAEEHLADLAAGTLRITSLPVSISVEVDGRPAVSTPVELRLAPGKHVVHASAPEYEPATREIEIDKGRVMQLAVALTPLPAPPAPPAPATPPASSDEALRVKVAAGVALGLAGVGLGVGTAYGVRALNAQSDYNRAPSQDAADRQKTSALVCDGSLGAAVVFAVVGAVLVTHPHAADPAPASVAGFRLVPLVSPPVQGAAAVWRF